MSLISTEHAQSRDPVGREGPKDFCLLFRLNNSAHFPLNQSQRFDSTQVKLRSYNDDPFTDKLISTSCSKLNF